MFVYLKSWWQGILIHHTVSIRFNIFYVDSTFTCLQLRKGTAETQVNLYFRSKGLLKRFSRPMIIAVSRV